MTAILVTLAVLTYGSTAWRVDVPRQPPTFVALRGTAERGGAVGHVEVYARGETQAPVWLLRQARGTPVVAFAVGDDGLSGGCTVFDFATRTRWVLRGWYSNPCGEGVPVRVVWRHVHCRDGAGNATCRVRGGP